MRSLSKGLVERDRFLFSVPILSFPMLEEKREKKENIDSVSYRIQELSEQRIELNQAVEAAALRDPNAYVTALVDLQRCERQLGLLLSTKRQAQDTKLLQRGGKDEDTAGGGMSITIFFLSGVDFEKVHKKVSKIVQWKWLRGCIYAYEQKGEDELTIGHNPHVHIFAPTQYAKHRAIKELTTSLHGLIYSPASVHVKWKPRPWLETCQSYLTGKKSGVLESAYQVDRLWRDRHGLPHPEVTALEFIVPDS